MSNATTTEIAHDRWNGRGNLQQLVQELERQKESRIDFVADTRHLWIENRGGKIVLQPKPNTAVTEFLPNEGLELSDSAFAQLCGKVEPNVPVEFGRKLTDVLPDSAANLFNDLLPNGGSGKRRFVRCLDGQVRAFLSNNYRVMDHFDIAFAALETVQACGGQVIEASLDDRRMRLKFTTQSVWDSLDAAQQQHDGTRPAGIGNHTLGNRLGWWTNPNYVNEMPGGPGTVHPLLTIDNSETGQGGQNIKVGILQGVCFNGSIVETLVSHTHLGGAMGLGRYSDETRSAESKSIMLKARDDIRAAFDPEVFKRLVDKVRNSQNVPIENAAPALDQIIKATEITEDARDSILKYFIRDYKPTAYGMAQAISRHAQDVDSPEVSNTLEEIAGQVMLRPQIAVVA